MLLFIIFLSLFINPSVCRIYIEPVRNPTSTSSVDTQTATTAAMLIICTCTKTWTTTYLSLTMLPAMPANRLRKNGNKIVQHLECPFMDTVSIPPLRAFNAYSVVWSPDILNVPGLSRSFVGIPRFCSFGMFIWNPYCPMSKYIVLDVIGIFRCIT